MKVTLIRHAESVANLSPHIIWGRTPETPLSTEGIHQAQLLGEYLLRNWEDTGLIYVSPARRTRETAQIALGSARPFVESVALHEVDQGVWEWQPRVEVYTPHTLEVIRRMNGWFRPSGGESPQDVQQRMVGWLRGLESGNIHTAFTHGYAIRTLVGGLLGWDFNELYNYECPNTSRTVLEKTDGEWRVVKFADVRHLNPQL